MIKHVLVAALISLLLIQTIDIEMAIDVDHEVRAAL